MKIHLPWIRVTATAVLVAGVGVHEAAAQYAPYRPIPQQAPAAAVAPPVVAAAPQQAQYRRTQYAGYANALQQPYVHRLPHSSRPLRRKPTELRNRPRPTARRPARNTPSRPRPTRNIRKPPRNIRKPPGNIRKHPLSNTRPTTARIPTSRNSRRRIRCPRRRTRRPLSLRRARHDGRASRRNAR